MKRVLIAGGAGFIGSHLCDRFLSEGYEVFCVDNLYTGTIDNIKHLEHEKRFHFLEHSILKPLKISCELVLNFACPASPPHYQKDPIFTARTSFEGTLNLLELARENHARFLLASTSEVYGDPEIHPQPETYRGNVNTIGIRSCYDEGKRIAETLTMDYHRFYQLDTKIIRIFNTYGPRMLENDGRVVSNFIVQALKGEPITIYGDGSQTRSFCYISDLVEGIYRMCTKDNFTGPVNLGNPEEYTVADFARLIKELTQSSSEICFYPLPQDDPRKRRPDISLAKKELAWEPTVPVRDGLTKTIAYFQEKLASK
ncbi:UDP-glucuronic acid decarboxylase family protein [Thermospira aquatica]|uniref:UDP-glucuronate decarboxylase n=1 Tax=Thermospira aquatica TaxID=2828656 RepID=A0AAX3BCZ7_9SPIR|nr:UDP-glucuronic acid decarboxylase family protein [Thermospira aquatica]URA10162.1 SDR family oxidoreductase [Thermospira aquatica]